MKNSIQTDDSPKEKSIRMETEKMLYEVPKRSLMKKLQFAIFCFFLQIIILTVTSDPVLESILTVDF